MKVQSQKSQPPGLDRIHISASMIGIDILNATWTMEKESQMLMVHTRSHVMMATQHK